jgi:hypothetical protein
MMGYKNQEGGIADRVMRPAWSDRIKRGRETVETLDGVVQAAGRVIVV